MIPTCIQALPLLAASECSSTYVKSMPALLSLRLRLEEPNKMLEIPFSPGRLGIILNASWNVKVKDDVNCMQICCGAR
jgi:hypothetical protein